MALFCLAVAMSNTHALEDFESGDFDLEFEARGPDGLKKCQKMMEKLVTAYRTCVKKGEKKPWNCLLYTSPSPRDQRGSRMPSSA